MATHARQQYFADESSLSKEKREFSIAEEVQQKIDSIEEGAQVNKIETIKVNGSEVQPDENKAVDLTIPGVVDSLDSTSSTDALSARQGKVLYDYIQDVSHIGHFLALWDASTGLPVTDPETSPYIYNTGDFYTVSVVASGGGTNYKPDGTQYVIGQASTTVDTDDVAVNDFYFYDGATWRHMKNSGAGSIAVDGSLSTTSTNPVENRVITNALNGKADATDINTKTFFLADRDDLTTAQAAIDWYRAGDNPIIKLGNSVFLLHNINSGVAKFVESTYFESNSSGVSQYLEYVVDFNMSNRTVTSISPHGQNMVSYLDTMRTPSGTFTPTLDWQPATKKYVDDHAGVTYTAGANIQISNENVISATDTKYTAGTGISIDANNVISNTQTSAEWGNITGTLSDQTDLQSALDGKVNLGVNKVFDNTVVEIGKWEQEQGSSSSGHNVTINPNGEVSTYNVTTGGHNEATLGSANLTLLESSALGGDETTVISQDGITITEGQTTQTYNFLGNDRIAKLSDVSGVAADVNTKTFTLPSSLSSQDAITVAQEAFDRHLNGKTPILRHGNRIYVCVGYSRSGGSAPSYWLDFNNTRVGTGTVDGEDYVYPSSVGEDIIRLTYDNSTNVVSQVENVYINKQFLPANSTTQVQYTPTRNRDPATKKYVDDSVITYNAGPGIEIGNVSDYSAMQGPAPSGFHVPSKDEWETLCGILTGTFGMDSNATTMGTYLKMPLAGYRNISLSRIDEVGSNGSYWGSTCLSANFAYALSFRSSSLSPQGEGARAIGSSIRCFKDTPVTPDSSWTTLYQGTGSAGVFRNSSLGLISVSGDGTIWYTIQDKNLGATTVYNQGDTLTDANCGYFYQWGNNYGFPHSGTVTTSATKVDASSYGPGNYYSSSTYITGSNDWSSVRNDNLWGGVTGVITLDNAISNTGVLSVNGQTGDVTIAGTNTKTFQGYRGIGHLDNAQAVYDRISTGKYAIVEVKNGDNNWKGNVVFGPTDVTTGTISSWEYTHADQSSLSGGLYYEEYNKLVMQVADGVVTQAYSSGEVIHNNGHLVVKGDTAPSGPIQGSMWYDTTNNKLKAYDGTNWNEVGDGDMNYADFNWQAKTGTAITLDLTSTITPTANFTVNAPSTIKDGQTYILRVNNGATAYTMTLGTNITNPYQESTLLTADGIDQFVFLAIGGNLELQPSDSAATREYVESINGTSGPVTLKTINSTSIVGNGNIAVQATLSNITASTIKTGTSTTKYAVTAAALAGGLVRISNAENNILANGGKLWAGTQEDYEALTSYDEYTVYLTI